MPDIQALAEELPRQTMELQREVLQGGVPLLRLAPCSLTCAAACVVLESLLDLIQQGYLMLDDASCTRLLTVAGMALQVAPIVLGSSLSVIAGANQPPNVQAGFAQHFACMLDQITSSLQRLLGMLCDDDSSPLPPRVEALLRATQLRPAALLDWMGKMMDIVMLFMRTTGCPMPPYHFTAVIHILLVEENFEGVQLLVEQQPAFQAAMLSLAERALGQPPAALAAAASTSDGCAPLAWLCEIAASEALTDVRRASHGRGGGGSSGVGTSLLPTLTSLAVCSEMQAHRGRTAQACLLLEVLRLQAVLHGDCLASQDESRVLQLSDVHLSALGGPGGLPLLCSLAAEVAEAAARNGGSGSGNGGSTGDSSSDGSGSDYCSTDFGAWCLDGALENWEECLQAWWVAVDKIIDAPMPQPGSGSPSCTAAWRAAEALLRLLPTLPGQPVSTRTGWRSAAAIVADRGGPEAYDEHAEQQGFTDVVPAPLAQVSLRAAWQLLCIGPPSPHAMAPAEVAQAACDALSTACRAAHKLAPLFRPGSGNEGSLLVQQDLLALMRVLDAAMRSALQACGTWLAALPQGEEQSVASRRLDCALLLYLPALAALYSLPVEVHDAVGAQLRCELWQELVSEPALQGLWRGLLSSGSSNAGCGVDVLSLLGDAMGQAICESLMEHVDNGQPTSEQEFESYAAPLAVLGAALELGPAAAATRLAQHDAVLYALLGMPIRFTFLETMPDVLLSDDMHAWQPPSSGARVMMWRLAERLAPHLPGVDAERRASLARILTGLPAASAQEELAGIKALRQAVSTARDAASAARQQEAAAVVDPAEVQALALRRARALATRRSCGNPCCASLAGVSEAGARGKKCTGCRLVRFCGTECSKQDWRLHKRACRVLQQAAGDGGG